MKVRFYADITPGTLPPRDVWLAATRPIEKQAGCVRIAFDVVIPENFIDGVDHYAPDAELVK